MTKDSLIAELVKALHKARVYVESNARTFGFDSSLQLISEIDAVLSHARSAQSDKQPREELLQHEIDLLEIWLFGRGLLEEYRKHRENVPSPSPPSKRDGE